ncbi:MAG TPA: MFS transporter [Candidatus Limnocylindria bacterium]|jgi:MFS family permease
MPRPRVPQAYRQLLARREIRLLLAGLGVSSLGDGISTVTIAWLAVGIAPAGLLGLYVGLAVAAYTLPGVIGALTFGRFLRGRPARTLVLVHAILRAGSLSAIALLALFGALTPPVYVLLLATSSLMAAWGNAGEYTMLSALAGASSRFAVNSLASAQTSLAFIVGPLLAGTLLAILSPGWLLLADALTFAFLGAAAWLTRTDAGAGDGPVDMQAAESGFRLLRRRDLLSLTVLTWLFFLLYGPVEVALPVYVAEDVGASAQLLAAYWTAFGVGALVSILLTGALRAGNMRRIALLIVAGWGACLIPFAGAPIPVTVAFFAIGGIVYGPFVPLTYSIYQSATTERNLPSLLAARSALMLVSTPLGTALGGPLVGALGGRGTLLWSGIATVVLAVAGAIAWRERTQAPTGQLLDRHST